MYFVRNQAPAGRGGGGVKGCNIAGAWIQVRAKMGETIVMGRGIRVWSVRLVAEAPFVEHLPPPRTFWC